MALQRSDIQRDILVTATRGRDSLDGLNWGALDSEVIERLDPLQDIA